MGVLSGPKALARIGELSPFPRMERRACRPGRGSLEAVGGMRDLRQGLVRRLDDLSSCSGLTPVLEVLKSEGVRSWLSVPLIAQEELIGSLNLGSDRPAAFTAEAVTVAHEVANPLAIAIRHARLYEEVPRAASVCSPSRDAWSAPRRTSVG